MGKSKKKTVAAEPPTLSKKQRKALEAREAELAAELAKREAEKAARKAAKKAAKKADKKAAESMSADALGLAPVDTPAAETHPHVAHLERVGELQAIIDDPTAKKKARKAAQAELDQLHVKGEKLNAMKAAKKGAAKVVAMTEDDADRAIDNPARDAIDAEVAARVAAAAASRAGSPERTNAMQDKVAADRAEREKAWKDAAVEVAPTGHSDDGYEKVNLPGDYVEPQVVEEVATETGREFAVGSAQAEDDFAKPSDAEPMLEEGRNGYKIIQLGKDGKPDPRKVRQMTRVTTFVGNIDDETSLKKWDKRKVIEGLAMDATSPESEGLIPKINDIVHERDVAIAKATKADRKGKLGIGEVGALVAAAEKKAKDALDEIHERAAELAGRHAKADAGTHLHALAEIADAKGIDAVRKMHEDGETIRNDKSGEDVPVTATDLASIEAYSERMSRLGAKVLHAEAVIVNDELGYAGRLDRIIMARLPELHLVTSTGVLVRPADQRARRYVADIKSGRVDLGAGKIARQLAAYALGDLYDLETGARTRHSAGRDIALVFHLPQGEGVCTVHAVDLKSGAAMLKLSAEVRRARNTGRKAIDLTVDIADPATDEAVGT